MCVCVGWGSRPRKAAAWGHPPVLHGAEGLLAGDVVHQQEPHGPPVVSRGDGPVALLAGCVLGRRDWGGGGWGVANYVTIDLIDNKTRSYSLNSEQDDPWEGRD